MRDAPQEVLAIFTAALQGVVASPLFMGPQFQGDPNAAVKFARACVRAAFDGREELELPNLICDPVEAALRAVESKHLPSVAIMVDAALKAEREACAKIAEDHSYQIHLEMDSYDACAKHVMNEIAAAIRHRSNDQ